MTITRWSRNAHHDGVALVTRSRDLASAAIDLFDNGGEHGAATKTIFAGMR